MSPDGEGHLFADEVDLDAEIRLYLALEPPGPPWTWVVNELGQPLWLLQLPLSQTGAGWGVIVSPNREVWTRDVRAARILDRRRQGLAPPADEGAVHKRLLAGVGPASMPAIPWATRRPQKKGNPGLAWTSTDLAACAAWLADIRGWMPRRVEELFSGIEDKRESEQRHVRRRGRRHIDRGREVLAYQGVWPWACVPPDDEEDEMEDGYLPDRWWETDWVLAWLEVWYRCAMDEASERKRELRQLADNPGW